MISNQTRFLLVVAFVACTAAENDQEANFFSYLRRELGVKRNPKANAKAQGPKNPKAQGPKTGLGFFKKECYSLSGSSDACSANLDCKFCDAGGICIPASMACCKYAVDETACTGLDDGCEWSPDPDSSDEDAGDCEAIDCDDIDVEGDCTALDRCEWDTEDGECGRKK